VNRPVKGRGDPARVVDLPAGLRATVWFVRFLDRREGGIWWSIRTTPLSSPRVP